MGEAFRLGGWGMYPTLIVGLVLVGHGVAHAWHPTARRAAIVRSMSVLTVFVASLGFVTGLINSFTKGQGSEVVVGIGESLNNIGLGLVLLVLAWTAHTVGAARLGAKSDRADLMDPHR